MLKSAKSLSDRRTVVRRIARLVIGSSLLGVTLSACAVAQRQPRDPDDVPFWEREEQRD